MLVTDRHGTGTNVLGLRPPGAIDVAFGPGSRIAHRLAAEAADVAYLEVDGLLTVDLDTPDDLVYVGRPRCTACRWWWPCHAERTATPSTDRNRSAAGQAGGVERRPAGQVHGDRVGPVGGDRLGHAGVQVVEHVVPRGRRAVGPPPHERPVETPRIVVQRGDRPPLRARVAAGERVIGVAPDLFDGAVDPDRDDDPAHGVADATERAVLLPVGHAAVSQPVARMRRMAYFDHCSCLADCESWASRRRVRMQQAAERTAHEMGSREPVRPGAPVWVLLVGLALLVLAVGPRLAAPTGTTPVRPATVDRRHVASPSGDRWPRRGELTIAGERLDHGPRRTDDGSVSERQVRLLYRRRAGPATRPSPPAPPRGGTTRSPRHLHRLRR